MQTALAVGFYGKLPCKGDFLQRRVPQEFVDAWDAWLQQCMHASRQQLQDRWLEAYLTSPVWRFVLAEGVCGSGAYAGVMLPSVDRVGRYFPLTVIAQLSSDDCLLDIACDAARQWFDSVESLALAALHAADLDLEAFDDRVASLADQIGDHGAAESVYLRGLMQQTEFAQRPAQWHVPLASADSLQRAANVFASRELERVLRPLALWWTEGSDAVAPGWLCNRGLPDPSSFVAMLAAGWNRAGWVSLDPDSGRDAEFARAVAQAEPLSSPAVEPPPLATSSGPPLEIVAWHEPVSREWGAPDSPARFISRPELGLWGIACSDAEDPTNAAAQMVIDVLQSVPQAGTLTGLVEEVRRALERVHHHLARPARTARGAQTVVFLARGDECALVCAGDVQAVRYRSSEVLPIIAAAERTNSAPEVAATADPGASLMDLLAAPATPDMSIIVRYEVLRPGDAWVLAGEALLDELRLPELAPALTAAELLASEPLAAVRNICRVEANLRVGALPLLLLAARPTLGG